ncbi:unnamed protein product [Calypogeia fissa]
MAKILVEQDNEEDDDNSGDELTNSAYGTRDLAGLKIRHGFDKVMEGHAVVLTLKDTNVLDGDDVNLAGDELESIEMAEQQAREDAYKAAKKKPGSYEDKFGNDMDALVTRKILPQYDDAVKDEGMVLDANGGLSEESRKKLEEVRLRLEGSSAKESLIGTSAKPVSDYFTEEDMLQFKKPKNKKKLRKKEKLDIDELEAEAVAAGLGSGDLGARDSEGRRAQQLADAQAEAESRKNAYQNALDKAEDASMILWKESTVEAMEVDKADSPVSSYEDIEPPPPGMPEVFRCLQKTSRASLSAIARHLRLRSDAFASILDDSPLPSGETSSSVLTAMSFHHAGGGGKSMMASDSGNEVEKGLLMLIAADTAGLQVCDPNGNWFLADNTVVPGDLILLTGRALQQATAGLRKASPYRVVPLSQNGPTGSTGRTSLAFRLMPRSNATIDSAAVANAGHSVRDGYGTISVAAFMDGLTAAEALTSNGFEHSIIRFLHVCLGQI